MSAGPAGCPAAWPSPAVAIPIVLTVDAGATVPDHIELTLEYNGSILDPWAPVSGNPLTDDAGDTTGAVDDEDDRALHGSPSRDAERDENNHESRSSIRGDSTMKGIVMERFEGRHTSKKSRRSRSRRVTRLQRTSGARRLARARNDG